jgi:hypothetical protein
MQDRTFDASMPAELIRAVVAACSVGADRSESLRKTVILQGVTEFDDVPARDEPAPAFIR